MSSKEGRRSTTIEMSVLVFEIIHAHVWRGDSSSESVLVFGIVQSKQVRDLDIHFFCIIIITFRFPCCPSIECCTPAYQAF